MRNKLPVLFAALMVLSACAPAPTSADISAPQTLAPTTVDAVSTPFPTPSADIPRWILYERALSYTFLGSAGKTFPDMSKDHGWCEWEIWGQNENEVYVWALCQANNTVGTATSAPAVIRLGKDGTILEVEMPNEGFGNLNDLFPENIVTRISKHEFPADAAWDRIQKRKGDSSIVPLIVEQGATLP